MKFETRTDEDGKVVLKLGLTHEMGFPVEPDLEAIITGVHTLIEAVTSISTFDMTQAVVAEYIKNGKKIEEFQNVTVVEVNPDQSIS